MSCLSQSDQGMKAPVTRCFESGQFIIRSFTVGYGPEMQYSQSTTGMHGRRIPEHAFEMGYTSGLYCRYRRIDRVDECENPGLAR